MITQAGLAKDLRNIGIQPGDIVLAHISMKAIGMIDGAEDTLLAAFFQTLTDAGTLCLAGHSKCGPPWYQTPPLVWHGTEEPAYGRVPKAMALMDGTCRSIHPCVSMLARGAHAREIVAGHELLGSPCGPGSPWHKLATQYRYAKVLRIGFFSTTLVDVVMDTVKPEAGLTPAYPTRAWLGVSDPGDPEMQVWRECQFRYHVPARIRNKRFGKLGEFAGDNRDEAWEAMKGDTIQNTIGHCMAYVTNVGQTYDTFMEMAK